MVNSGIASAITIVMDLLLFKAICYTLVKMCYFFENCITLQEKSITLSKIPWISKE